MVIQALLVFVSYWSVSVVWLGFGGDAQWVWLALLPAVWFGSLFMLRC